MSLQVQARIYRPWKMMRAACLLFWLTALAARAEPPSIDNANFGEVVTASRQPFVIEFYSEMCGSCKEFAPRWEALAHKLPPMVQLARVRVDENFGLVQRYRNFLRCRQNAFFVQCDTPALVLVSPGRDGAAAAALSAGWTPSARDTQVGEIYLSELERLGQLHVREEWLREQLA